MKEKKQQMVVSLNYYAGCFLVFCQDDRNSPPTVNSQSFIRNSEHEKKDCTRREKKHQLAAGCVAFFSPISHIELFTTSAELVLAEKY